MGERQLPGLAAGGSGEGLGVGEGADHGREVRGPEIGSRSVKADGEGQLGRLTGGLLDFQIGLFPNQVVEERAEPGGERVLRDAEREIRELRSGVGRR